MKLEKFTNCEGYKYHNIPVTPAHPSHLSGWHGDCKMNIKFLPPLLSIEYCHIGFVQIINKKNKDKKNISVNLLFIILVYVFS